jgi:hypothetical protein
MERAPSAIGHLGMEAGIDQAKGKRQGGHDRMLKPHAHPPLLLLVDGLRGWPLGMVERRSLPQRRRQWLDDAPEQPVG